MIRMMLARALLVALPFAAWFAWTWWARRTGRTVPPAPYAWLFLGGMVLMALSLFATALIGDEHTDDRYVPAEVVDGRVVPQRFEERPPQPEPPRRTYERLPDAREER